MWPRFGIKVGNSTLCIASVKVDGKIEVIANKQGDRVSQACLLWNGGDEIECGLTAQQKMTSRPSQAAANSFQFLVPHEELTSEKIESATKEITCAYDADNHQFELRVDNSDVDETPTLKISPFNVHVNLLKSEFELAQQFLGNDSDQKPCVVLSIPSYYTEASWPLLAQIAEEAGFHVAQIITEHTAAVLAYGIGDFNSNTDLTLPTESKYVLSIKCGGLFSHFALYELTKGMYTLLDSSGPVCIGGKQFTEALIQFICEEFHRKYKLDPHESRRSMIKIRTAAANCKHILTTRQSTQIYIDSLMDGIDFNMHMSRARFESIIQPVISNFLQTLNEAIDQMFQHHTNVTKIDEIVLLGGTMQIPKLQSVISTRCPEAKLNASLAADEVVAIGCARQATFLADPEGQDLQLTEECVCAETDAFIWHETNEANARILLPKGTLLPSVVTVDIEIDASAKAVDDGINTFHIKVGDEVQEVCLSEATATAEGVFKIEADVCIIEGENESGKTTAFKLRCL